MGIEGGKWGFASGFSMADDEDSGCDCSGGVCTLRVVDEECFEAFE